MWSDASMRMGAAGVQPVGRRGASALRMAGPRWGQNPWPTVAGQRPVPGPTRSSVPRPIPVAPFQTRNVMRCHLSALLHVGGHERRQAMVAREARGIGRSPRIGAGWSWCESHARARCGTTAHRRGPSIGCTAIWLHGHRRAASARWRRVAAAIVTQARAAIRCRRGPAEPRREGARAQNEGAAAARRRMEEMVALNRRPNARAFADGVPRV